jgi:tetratricopeptide (TPR) repeat protein
MALEPTTDLRIEWGRQETVLESVRKRDNRRTIVENLSPAEVAARGARLFLIVIRLGLMFRLLAASVLPGGVILQADEYTDLFQKAAAYSGQGKYQEAILAYQAALKIRPGTPEALNNLAVMYYEAHEYRKAFDTASPIWASHPELKSAALITGMAAVQCNLPQEAIAPLEKLLGADPLNRDGLLALASAYVALKQIPKAIEIYQRETAVSPNDPTAWYGLAICYERSAEQASKTLAGMPGGSGFSKRLLAEYLQSTGDTKLAKEAFGEAQTGEAAPGSEAARQYEVARDLAAKSREAFEKFVSIAPESWQAEVFLGDVARQHGDLVSALAHYQKAAQKQSGNPASLLGMGTVYWEMGNFDQAVPCLRRTLERNPQASQAIFELANIAVRRHSEREAIPLLKEFLAAQPDALAAHADLGRAYFHLEQYANAAIELEKAAAVDERGDIHYQLSVSLRKLGRTQEADSALKRSQEIREAQLERERRLHTQH